MENYLSGLCASNHRGMGRPDVERPSIEALGGIGPEPRPPREICGMPAECFHNRVFNSLSALEDHLEMALTHQSEIKSTKFELK
jgi:hypothetical protein